MEEITCRSCAYYRQHYALSEGKILRIHCGHCTYSKPKTKRPTAKICPFYKEGISGESAFVSKEYLSKALLERVLKTELLPEILVADEQILPKEKN